MDPNKVISAITRTGSVILTTVLSFLVLPPSIEGDSNSVINWKNILTFFAGVLSIVLYSWGKGKIKRKSTPLILVILLIIFAGAYEIIYDKYSIKCYDKLPIIITKGAVLPEMTNRLEYWRANSQDPIRSLVESNGCSSIKIWPMSAIAAPYYSLLFLYFAIVVIIVALVVATSDLITQSTP
jgi:hypothetical protein